MKSRELKGSAVKHVSEYIDTRLSGANKHESALEAGYSEEVARKPSIIESSKTYQVLVDEYLTDSAVVLRFFSGRLREMVANGQLDNMKPLEMAQMMKNMAQIDDILRPKITVKETKNKDGTTTRTAWGSNASVLHETLGTV